MTKGRIIHCLGLSVGVLLALAGSAQADRHLVKYRHAYPLADAKRSVVQGQRMNDERRARRPGTNLGRPKYAYGRADVLRELRRERDTRSEHG